MSLHNNKNKLSKLIGTRSRSLGLSWSTLSWSPWNATRVTLSTGETRSLFKWSSSLNELSSWLVGQSELAWRDEILLERSWLIPAGAEFLAVDCSEFNWLFKSLSVCITSVAIYKNKLKFHKTAAWKRMGSLNYGCSPPDRTTSFRSWPTKKGQTTDRIHNWVWLGITR